MIIGVRVMYPLASIYRKIGIAAIAVALRVMANPTQEGVGERIAR